MKKYLFFIFLASNIFASAMELGPITNCFAALEAYKDISGLELEIATDVKNVQGRLQIPQQTVTTAEALKVIDKALLAQGIIITKLDEKRASVTYNNTLQEKHLSEGDLEKFSFKNASLNSILESYQSISGLELIQASEIKNIKTPVSIELKKSMLVSELLELIEKRIAEQTGVIIKKVNSKQASVTYNDNFSQIVKQRPPPTRRIITPPAK
jgi:hypothetical protein